MLLSLKVLVLVVVLRTDNEFNFDYFMHEVVALLKVLDENIKSLTLDHFVRRLVEYKE